MQGCHTVRKSQEIRKSQEKIKKKQKPGKNGGFFKKVRKVFLNNINFVSSTLPRLPHGQEKSGNQEKSGKTKKNDKSQEKSGKNGGFL